MNACVALAVALVCSSAIAAESPSDPITELFSKYAVAPDARSAATDAEAPDRGERLAAVEADLSLAVEGLEAFAAPEALIAASRVQAAPHGVVALARKTEAGLEVHGAGVIVDGKVLTDRRVVEGCEDWLAILPGAAEGVALKIEREDAASGLALLAAKDALTGAVSLASALPAKDDLVWAVGHSQGLGAWARTKGLVTAVHEGAFQTDAVVDPGMAGGVVLDAEGKLAGLLTLKTVQDGGE